MPTSVPQGRRPFKQQIEFFRNKVSVPTAAWTDIFGHEHDTAFMVAGAAKADLLGDLRGAIDRAISEGRTLEDFRKDFDDIVARTGWAFNGGRNWRTRVIYETNLRQSYHAGREAQMADPDLRRRRPFGLYRHGGSDEPRPEHLALDGTAVPLDDPFWDEWTPMNGWGCSCKKFMISRAEADRLGLTVQDPGPRPPRETVTVGTRGPSPRTVDVPQGIDPGFAHRPGGTKLSTARARALERAEAAGGQLADDLAAHVEQARPTDPVFYEQAGRDWIQERFGGEAVSAVELRRELREAVSGQRPARVRGSAQATALVRDASARYPATWIEAADSFGPLRARKSQNRGWAYSHTAGPRRARLPQFGVVNLRRGDGYMVVGDTHVAVHEFGHRIQEAMPELNAVFQRLHDSRTRGEALQRLRVLQPLHRYRASERARPDEYVNPYFGKDYGERGALEVMAMALDHVLGDRIGLTQDLLDRDRELLYTTIGLLLRFKP